ncbi:MAG: hypothetical protein ACREMH_11490 [Gemmatimonadales bacterium]
MMMLLLLGLVVVLGGALVLVFGRGGPVPALDPEGRFVVRVDAAEVICERPDGTRERVTWDDLERVEIVSTSEGPRFPDTFWLLVGKVGGCAIPWGATGEAELLGRLQRLPGFDNTAVIGAASDATDARRTCWQRDPDRDRISRDGA